MIDGKLKQMIELGAELYREKDQTVIEAKAALGALLALDIPEAKRCVALRKREDFLWSQIRLIFIEINTYHIDRGNAVLEAHGLPTQRYFENSGRDLVAAELEKKQ